jgi:hypothetical protein
VIVCGVESRRLNLDFWRLFSIVVGRQDSASIGTRGGCNRGGELVFHEMGWKRVIAQRSPQVAHRPSLYQPRA